MLTSRAARRVAREGTLHSFDQAALALNEDWGTQLDGKQIQRWSEAIGDVARSVRDAEVQAYEQGHRPASVPNPPALLVIGMDGGRVQTREKQGENGSRWREDKVSAITSYLPGDGTKEHRPQPLVTTYVATMEKTEAFGKLVHVEAERRGLRQARTVLVMGDGGNWIDPLSKRERLHDQRIVDYYHAAEHLYEAARAALGKDASESLVLAEQLKESRAGQQCGILPNPPPSHGLPDVSAEGLADRVWRYRISGQAVQQTREGNGAILEPAGRGVDPGVTRPVAVAGRPLGTVLEHPPSLQQGRLNCHGPGCSVS